MVQRVLRTLPNMLSLSRLVLAGCFPIVRTAGDRAALIGVAAITDFLDGFIARRARLTSKWGALIDPIADRAFVLVAVTAFLLEGTLTMPQSLVLVSRDIMTAIGFVVARVVPWLRPVEFKARSLGKVVTTLQLSALFAVLVLPTAVSALVVIAGIASALAIADYTVALWRTPGR
ncbi:MAG: CDP-alcohol phosphatidyltransferase family protein [Gemmatimonadaceae bacterium]